MRERCRRNSWWLVLLLLPIWPLREALVSGDIPGAGPDVLSTLWGMWWFGQEWTGAAWGGWTGLANAGVDGSGQAYGAYGVVLSPLSATVWNLFEPWIGMGRAAAAVGVLQLGALAALTGLLVRDLGGSRLAAFAAGLGILGLRQSFFGLAEGSVVAVAALFVPLGILCLRRAARVDVSLAFRRRWAMGAGACMLALSLENPYLAPLLPVWAGCMLLRLGWRWRALGERPVCLGSLGLGLGLGLVCMLLISGLFKGAASSEYPVRDPKQFVSVIGLQLEVVEKSWARIGAMEWVTPASPRWTLEHTQGVQAHGDGYVGLVLLLLAFFAVVWTRRSAGPYLALALAGLVLSLGSVAGAVPLPFAFLNGLMDAVARPLTQPSRFLSLAGLGLSVSAALALDVVWERWRWRGAGPLVGALALDGLVLGGLSLDIPRTAVPDAPCVESLGTEPAGIVAIWPEDASLYEGDLGRTWLLQLIHEQPSVHPGIASWKLHPETKLAPDRQSRTRLREELRFHYHTRVDRETGVREEMGMPEAGRPPDVVGMLGMGIDWVVVDVGRDPSQAAWAVEQFGTPERECAGYQVHRLGEAP